MDAHPSYLRHDLGHRHPHETYSMNFSRRYAEQLPACILIQFMQATFQIMKVERLVAIITTIIFRYCFLSDFSPSSRSCLAGRENVCRSECCYGMDYFCQADLGCEGRIERRRTLGFHTGDGIAHCGSSRCPPGSDQLLAARTC